MKNIILFGFVIILSCSQTDNKQDNYTELELKVEKCYDNWFSKRNVDWSELQSSFEEYFVSFGISKADEPIEKQYEAILSYISHPTKWFPTLKDKKRIIKIRNKLGLSEDDILSHKQLSCYTDIYVANKAKADTTSCFYIFGSCFEAITQIPDISPGLLSKTILMFIDTNELKKPIYQKTIILMFYFYFAALIPNENKTTADYKRFSISQTENCEIESLVSA